MAKEVTYASALEARAAASKSRTIDRADDGNTLSQISQRQTRITSGDISDVMARARGTWERLKAGRAATQDNGSIAYTARATDEDLNGVDSSRRGELIHRFFELSSSQRRKVVAGLNLLDQDEMLLPDTSKYEIFFARARERNVMDEVTAAVASMGR